MCRAGSHLLKRLQYLSFQIVTFTYKSTRIVRILLKFTIMVAFTLCIGKHAIVSIFKRQYSAEASQILHPLISRSLKFVLRKD